MLVLIEWCWILVYVLKFLLIWYFVIVVRVFDLMLVVVLVKV